MNLSSKFNFVRLLRKDLLYHRLAAFLFLAAFSTQYFNRVLILADYYLNPGDYAKVCENKSRPELHCYGKCVVVKKLGAEEKKENQDRRAENREELSLSSHSFNFNISPPKGILVSENSFKPFSSDPLSDRTSDVFHPPCS